MIPPLCLGCDPGARCGLAVVEPRPGQRPRLLLLRVIAADTPDAWAERAFLAAEAVAKVAAGRDLVGWAELIPPTDGDGWKTALSLAERRGQIRQALTDAGLSIARFEDVYLQTWTSLLGVPRGKQGSGRSRGHHRVSEAERLVEMPAETLRGLGDATVDAAEALLISAARAEKWARDAGLVEVPKKRRARRAA